MSNPAEKTAGINRWPARLDMAEGISGLMLLAFIWTHMIMVSSILISKDAMYMVARFFEGMYIFGAPHVWLVSTIAVIVFVLLVIHAVIAIRKIPGSYRQYRAFLQHRNRMQHGDTSLWLLQVITGFLLMFLASAHIYQMFSQPGAIGPYASADRIWTDTVWPLYLVLLFSVELHGGIGLYRLLLKWGWFDSASLAQTRRRLQRAKWIITVFFIALGLLTLAAYIRLGVIHAPAAGERYQPLALILVESVGQGS